jgi:hypothetical protein
VGRYDSLAPPHTWSALPITPPLGGSIREGGCGSSVQQSGIPGLPGGVYAPTLCIRDPMYMHGSNRAPILPWLKLDARIRQLNCLGICNTIDAGIYPTNFILCRFRYEATVSRRLSLGEGIIRSGQSITYTCKVLVSGLQLVPIPFPIPRRPGSWVQPPIPIASRKPLPTSAAD